MLLMRLSNREDMQLFLLSNLIYEGADCVVQLLFRPDPDQRRVQPLLLLAHARLSPAIRVRYYQCGAPVKHQCKCFTVSPVQIYFTGVLIFAVNGAFSYKT